MADDGVAWWDTALNAMLVLVGVGYAIEGAPLFGLDPTLVGGALVAYGTVSYFGKWAAHRWGLLDRD